MRAIYSVPTAIPVASYSEPAYQTGCNVGDGNVVKDGDEIIDRENCRVGLEIMLLYK